LETRANYAIIGVFTLAILAGAFGFVYWFAGRDTVGRRLQYNVVFTGSVSGLSRGSTVLFNGIRKGEVLSITLDKADPHKVIAVIGVDPDTPIRQDTEAKLEYQGLTGIASIQLSGGSPAAQPLRAADGRLPAIEAKRSDFQDILATVQRLSERADDVLSRASKLIADNEASIGRTVRNVEGFSDALARNSEGVSRFLSSTAEAADRIAQLSVQLQDIVKAIEPARIAKIVADVEAFTGAVAANRGEIDSALKDAASLARRLNDASGRVEALVADAQALVRSFEPGRVARVVENADRFLATLGENTAQLDKALKEFASITGRLDGVMATIETNRPEISAMLKDAANLAKRLNDAAPKLDAALADVSGLAKAFDPAKVGRVVDNVDRFASALGDNRAAIDKALKEFSSITGRFDSVMATIDANRAEIAAMLKDGASLARRLNDAVPKLDAALADVSGLAKAFDPAKVGQIVDNVDRFAAALGDNRDNVDKALREAASITGKVDSASGKLDAVLTALQNLLGSAAGADTKGLVAEIVDTARAIRTLALNLDGRTAEITAGISRFTGSGVKDVRALTDDGRKTLGDIQRVLRSLERNPQQLILGGRPPIPEYRGRR
jgi:phospholipid/cholesterol/gamma-HCH transport system substrate-binding protein